MYAVATVSAVVAECTYDLASVGYVILWILTDTIHTVLLSVHGIVVTLSVEVPMVPCVSSSTLERQRDITLFNNNKIC